MSDYNYYKVFFVVNGGSRRVEYIEGPSWGVTSTSESEIKDKIMAMYPDANRSSIQMLRCSREEFEKKELN